MLAQYPLHLWQILLDLAPSLLLGLFIAGLMHVYLPLGLIRSHLNRPTMASVAQASVLGVPLPLCSCGVIPTALGLRRDGASPGATTAFMISTPQTGVDSILVSAAFLGWPFALFKVLAAFVTGLVGGGLVNRWVPGTSDLEADRTHVLDRGDHRAAGLLGAVRYAIFDLLAVIDLWLIGGVLVAALVTTLTPPDFFAGQVWAQGLLGMLVVLAISLPLYVCTTASVPIAASLIAAGMPAGSALVFLMAGPSTNVATIGAVYRALGGRVLAIYLGTVVLMSLLFGLLFDRLLASPTATAAPHVHGVDWIAVSSALVLVALLGWLVWQRLLARPAINGPVAADETRGDLVTLQVKGMSCQHCVASVKRALEGVAQVESAEPDLTSGLVQVRGTGVDGPALVQAVETAGFSVAGPVAAAGEAPRQS
ncbi:MAG: hypothetical protein EA400_11535 [Chromatiaceae bacterium]|nr:MAG: hypothetical protein EA400_11535 [Chromatiaceae bacterium]